MAAYSSQLLFEEAEIIKKKIEILEKFHGKSTIVNPKIRDMDVFSMIDDEDYSFINFLKIVNGAIVMAHNTEVIKRLEEDKIEILGSVVFDLRKRFNSRAREVIVPFKPDIIVDDVLFTIPLKGDKKRVLDLSFRNATSFRADKMALKLKDKWSEIENKVLVTLMNDLKMNSLPTHIECFDNSNIQGSEPVASCVVFKYGKPYKSAYRHFNIKTVTGPNDYASMEEVVGRRYKRMIEQNEPLPDLIIIDGGKGQLSSTVRSLKSLGLYGKSSIISIAKRLEEIYLPDDPIPLYLDKTSASLKLIQRIRDEAHRFGISFHRNKRSKSQLQSAFTSIKGVGTVTRDKLLKSGIDLERLKEMSLNEIKLVAGEKASKAIYNYLRTKGD
jgi:excinuclease ABC subunit C